VTTRVIGISTYREEARWGVWDTLADVLHADYARAVEGAGAVAVLLPPGDPARASAVLARLDGLVIAGGADVDPAQYGEDAHPSASGWRPDRDAWELALLDAAEAADLPTLMICRGMQLEAVRRGGRLEQHTPDRIGTTAHSPGGPEYGEVGARTVAGSRLAGLVGESVEVRCHHHQSVLTHPGLVATATAADGTVEAFEDPSRRFWVGVQWHPETFAGPAGEQLFGAMVAS
jgi:putative glutamine amidotransferase